MKKGTSFKEVDSWATPNRLGPSRTDRQGKNAHGVSVAKACTMFSRGGAAQLERHDFKDAELIRIQIKNSHLVR
jgi:hypothetical protein